MLKNLTEKKGGEQEEGELLVRRTKRTSRTTRKTRHPKRNKTTSKRSGTRRRKVKVKKIISKSSKITITRWSW